MRPVAIPHHIKRIWQPAADTAQQVALIKEMYPALLKKTPEVSIVIPAYNEEAHILKTLASLVLNKTRYSTEIIVVNNNSTDNTEMLLQQCGVRYVNEKTQGITTARNAGLKAANGKYILNADADAIYPPLWVDSMVRPLALTANISLTYGRFAFLPVGKTGRGTYFLYEHAADMLRLVNKYIKEEAVNVYGFNSAFKRADGIAVDGFHHPPGTNEDGYLAMKLRDGGFGKLQYVTHINALVWVSDRRIQSDGGLFKAIKKRAARIFFPSRYKETRTDL